MLAIKQNINSNELRRFSLDDKLKAIIGRECYQRSLYIVREIRKCRADSNSPVHSQLPECILDKHFHNPDKLQFSFSTIMFMRNMWILSIKYYYYYYYVLSVLLVVWWWWPLLSQNDFRIKPWLHERQMVQLRHFGRKNWNFPQKILFYYIVIKV